MATYHELKAQAEMLLKEAEELRKQEVAEAIRDIKEKMEQYGITAEDLVSSGKKMVSKKPAVVKYLGPNGEEWSGRGRTPGWMVEAEKRGSSREDFAV
ncbi:H-NS histone family protein [Neopusillimonas aromaticivorans]|uniref:H-NS histone family protein n=1 Tax=Neopusillimonas aromaticivorans TaxID=2979868 RepID=UPI002592E051|nr:H-NS histone family protein [Neopusillimonas aromaticivorans]WJJ93614.1 H-NS histone family protein [Neopusillimonas aromaticivorans]